MRNSRIWCTTYAVVCAALCPVFSSAASLDCNSSGLTPSDQLVCGNPVLSNLDSDLAAAYANAWARSLPEEQVTLLTEQRVWIVRRSECADASCLAHLYTLRISALNAGIKPATLVDDWNHVWVRLDERDIFDSVMTVHTITEVDASSIVHESADQRAAFIRSTAAIDSRSLKQIMTAHYAVGCSSRVFVIRDANVTATSGQEDPQIAKVAGQGSVSKTELNSIDFKIINYACRH